MMNVCHCRALMDLLDQVPGELKRRTARIAFDGTSATALLLDSSTGDVLEPPKLYNEAQPEASRAAAQVRTRHARSHDMPVSPCLPAHSCMPGMHAARHRLEYSTLNTAAWR